MKKTAIIAALLMITAVGFAQTGSKHYNEYKKDKEAITGIVDKNNVFITGNGSSLSNPIPWAGTLVYTGESLKADTVFYPLIVWENTSSKVVLKITADKKIHVYDSMRAIERLVEELTKGKPALVHKPDTVAIPVYLFDITDTVSATVLYKEKEGSNRIYSTKGFALLRGFKAVDKGKLQWVDKPGLVGALNEKKQPLKNVIQVL